MKQLFYFYIFALLIVSNLQGSSDIRKVLSDEEYKIAFEVLCNNSGHQQKIVEMVRGKVLQHHIDSNSWLDIGSGQGGITRQVAPLFNTTTIIEPNNDFAKDFIKDGFEVHNLCLDDYVTDRKFDFILCSHVLYHIPHEEWQRSIDKMLSMLSPQGVLAIAMEASEGQAHELRRHFDPATDFSLEKVTKIPKYSRELIITDHTYTTRTEDEMFTLCRFIVLENCYSPEKYFAFCPEQQLSIDNMIKAYVRNMQNHANDTYSLGWKQEIVFLSRQLKPTIQSFNQMEKTIKLTKNLTKQGTQSGNSQAVL